MRRAGLACFKARSNGCAITASPIQLGEITSVRTARDSIVFSISYQVTGCTAYPRRARGGLASANYSCYWSQPDTSRRSIVARALDAAYAYVTPSATEVRAAHGRHGDGRDQIRIESFICLLLDPRRPTPARRRSSHGT
jgi:hypothetical protein